MDTSRSKKGRHPYRPLRDDPRYDEIKKMIEDFPPENLEKLKRYIQQWLRRV